MDIFFRLLSATYLIACLFASNAIEFFINPEVHRIHNCPDVMQIPWYMYKWYHAGHTAILASWWIIIPVFVLFNVNGYLVFVLGIISLAIPLLVQGNDDIYLGHKLLYGINTLGFFLNFVL